MPSPRRARHIRSVSSHSRAFLTVDRPEASAAAASALMVRLFEAGARTSASRRRHRSIVMGGVCAFGLMQALY